MLGSLPTQTPGAGSTDTDTGGASKQAQLSDQVGRRLLAPRGREEQGAGESAACRQKWQPAAAAGDGSLSTVSLTSLGVWGSTWDPRPHCGT